MLGRIFAFLAVATSVAFASTFGCYTGYGGSLLGAGVCGSRILTTGCAIPPFAATVGAPEVISSCCNSLGAPVLSTGIMGAGFYGAGYGLGYGSALGRCGTGLIAPVC